MEKVIVLGGGADQIRLIKNLKNRGCFVILCDRLQDPPAGKLADKHYPVCTRNRDEVYSIARKEKINKVFAVATDQPLVTAAYVSEMLGLYFPLSIEQSKLVTNKKMMKEILQASAIPTAKSIVVSIENIEKYTVIENKLRYPVIVKPTDNSGSRGVCRANNREALSGALINAIQNSEMKECIVEEYISGKEITVDGLAYDGRVELLTIMQNEKKKLGMFNRMIYPADIDGETERKVENILAALAREFKLEQTPFFVQMMVDEKGQPHVLEFGARIAGGSKPDLLPLFFNLDIVDMYVRLLYGEILSYQIKHAYNFASVNYIYCSEGTICRAEGAGELMEKGIIDYFVFYKMPGSYSQGKNNITDRVGSFFIFDNDKGSIRNRLIIANDKLKILDDNNRDIMAHELIMTEEEYENA